VKTSALSTFIEEKKKFHKNILRGRTKQELNTRYQNIRKQIKRKTYKVKQVQIEVKKNNNNIFTKIKSERRK
jgi:hypothetical protein